ncbi:hypothetical protein EGW08_001877 [Elysia chlorotica]|uniref:MARVEL domain-containing protein n=1 Tax=Elysia chlorotica TaxID=188477 RepID=A0A433U998_ELYCH|nr:hypothetical protein EGW08_001877 [Elysia chlorotica]
MKNPMLIAALITGSICCLLDLVGMATTGWVTNKIFDVGLFSLCADSCQSYSATGAIAAAKAFAVIGWLCAVSAIIDALIYFCKYAKNDEPNRLLPLISAILFFVSGISSFLAVISFAAKGRAEAEDAVGPADFGYSFALTIIGALLALASGGLTIVHRGRIGTI